MREGLRLLRSEVLSGAELYHGNDIETFATDWHFHQGWQLVTVTKGERRYQFRNSSIIASPGQFVVLPPRLIHKARCLARERTSFKIATLPEACFDVGAASAATSHSDPGLVGAFVSIFKMLASADDAETKSMILLRLQEILAKSRLAGGSDSPALPPLVLQIEAYMLERLDQAMSLECLSSLAGLSRYHFAHTFARHVGLSPLAFHARARLMQARSLIAQGWTLSQTSAYLKFSDQSHFGRHFKRVYDMTPGEYQKSIVARDSLQVRH
ncbi:MAG: helix-turn-helix domain-containing protein [Granulicella sp.]